MRPFQQNVGEFRQIQQNSQLATPSPLDPADEELWTEIDKYLNSNSLNLNEVPSCFDDFATLDPGTTESSMTEIPHIDDVNDIFNMDKIRDALLDKEAEAEARPYLGPVSTTLNFL